MQKTTGNILLIRPKFTIKKLLICSKSIGVCWNLIIFNNWLLILNVYILKKQNSFTHPQKKGDHMSHWIYFLLGITIGGLIGIVATYILVCGYYTRKMQQQKIIRFVRAMKRLSKTGNYPMVKESIKKFAEKCMNFNVESFKAFQGKEYETITHCVSMYQHQNLHSTYNDGTGTTQLFREMFENDSNISENETQKKICKSLCQIIGI